MSTAARQDPISSSLQGVLEQAGAVTHCGQGDFRPAHFGSPAGELAACCHAVGLLVNEARSAAGAASPTVSFELLGRRVGKVIRDLAELRPELEWSRPSPGRAITRVKAEEAIGVCQALVQAGRRHGLANVGEDCAARFRLLEAPRT